MSLEKTAFNGKPVELLEELPGVNQEAFDFTFVKPDLSESSLYDFEDKVKVLIAVPTIDTGIFQKDVRQFNERLAEKKGVVGIIISKDLPFAMKRFNEAEGLTNTNIVSASDFRYLDFTREYGTEMVDGPLKGLSARAVFVVDQNNKIRYVELTPDITLEPNYDLAMAAVDKLM